MLLKGCAEQESYTYELDFALSLPYVYAVMTKLNRTQEPNYVSYV